MKAQFVDQKQRDNKIMIWQESIRIGSYDEKKQFNAICNETEDVSILIKCSYNPFKDIE